MAFVLLARRAVFFGYVHFVWQLWDIGNIFRSETRDRHRTSDTFASAWQAWRFLHVSRRGWKCEVLLEVIFRPVFGDFGRQFKGSKIAFCEAGVEFDLGHWWWFHVAGAALWMRIFRGRRSILQTSTKKWLWPRENVILVFFNVHVSWCTRIRANLTCARWYLVPVGSLSLWRGANLAVAAQFFRDFVRLRSLLLWRGATCDTLTSRLDTFILVATQAVVARISCIYGRRSVRCSRCHECLVLHCSFCNVTLASTFLWPLRLCECNLCDCKRTGCGCALSVQSRA